MNIVPFDRTPPDACDLCPCADECAKMPNCEGMSQRASHFHTIPLCPTHHRAGGFGVAYHAGPRQFEKLYGTETELWNQVRERLRGAA